MRRALVCLVLAACAHRPTSVVSGDHWTVPLAHPLDQGGLIVPVTINGVGPLAFVIDPTAKVSVIDRSVAESLNLFSRDEYTRVADQDDHTVPARSFEVLALEAGDLHVRNIQMLGVRSLEIEGRYVQGILGGDVLSNSLVVDVDRDAGLLHLAVAGHEQVPAGADKIAAKTVWGNLLVPVTIDRARRWLAVKPNTHTTALWQSRLASLDPAPTPAKEKIVDETGTVAVTDVAHVAGALTLDGETLADLPVADYRDRRVQETDYDGVLGEDVLSRYHALIDLHRNVVWLAPRDGDLSTHLRERILRWGDTFAACVDQGCADVWSEHGHFEVAHQHDAKADGYRVVLERTDDAGRALASPLVMVYVSRGGMAVEVAAEGAAKLRVVDVAPL